MGCGDRDFEAELLDICVEDEYVGCDVYCDSKRRLNDEFVDREDGSNVGDSSSDSHIFFEERDGDGRQIEI